MNLINENGVNLHQIKIYINKRIKGSPKFKKYLKRQINTE